jgi:hypothetical protein
MAPRGRSEDRDTSAAARPRETGLPGVGFFLHD